MARIGEIIRGGWNAFKDRYFDRNPMVIGAGNSSRPDRVWFTTGTAQTIISAVYTRIANDCASIKIRHVQLDEEGRFRNVIKSPLNKVLTLSSNLDQSSRAFFTDVYLSLLDEGCIAIVPVNTDVDPKKGTYDIESLRVGPITQWYPEYVRVLLYNELTGQKEEVTVPKSTTAIVENPFYQIMNQPNSTVKRLSRKLALLDLVDEQNSSGKFNMVVQVPYKISTEAQRKMAKARLSDVESQLSGSKYGIAYIDSTEKIIQLNRALENNLMEQIQFLTKTFYDQTGITPEILNGTADETAMLNYTSRIVEPIVSSVVDEMTRKFLTGTAITQNKTIMMFKEPFKLVPINNIADIADKFTRNEILSPNEIRGIVGFVPSSDPEADKLRNRNINEAKEEMGGDVPQLPLSDEQLAQSIDELDSFDAQLDEMEALIA